MPAASGSKDNQQIQIKLFEQSKPLSRPIDTRIETSKKAEEYKDYQEHMSPEDHYGLAESVKVNEEEFNRPRYVWAYVFPINDTKGSRKGTPKHLTYEGLGDTIRTSHSFYAVGHLIGLQLSGANTKREDYDGIAYNFVFQPQFTNSSGEWHKMEDQVKKAAESSLNKEKSIIYYGVEAIYDNTETLTLKKIYIPTHLKVTAYKIPFTELKDIELKEYSPPKMEALAEKKQFEKVKLSKEEFTNRHSIDDFKKVKRELLTQLNTIHLKYFTGKYFLKSWLSDTEYSKLKSENSILAINDDKIILTDDKKHIIFEKSTSE